MLERYETKTNAEQNRCEVVKAALEIIKASVSSASGYDGKEKLGRDIHWATEGVSALADAIEDALKK